LNVIWEYVPKEHRLQVAEPLARDHPIDDSVPPSSSYAEVARSLDLMIKPEFSIIPPKQAVRYCNATR